MNQRTTNRIDFISLAFFVLGFLLVAFCSSAPHEYADFDCPVCGSDHVLVISEDSAQCPDCLTSFQY